MISVWQHVREGLFQVLHKFRTPWRPKYALSEMIGHMIEQEVHHRGGLSLILGMLGHKGLDV